RGLLAERRGEAEEAIEHYERAANGPAITRADALLRRVGERKRLLERAVAREAPPDDASAALLAAIALDDAASLTRVPEARVRHAMAPRPPLRFAEAYAREGCEGIARRLEEMQTVSAPEPCRRLHACLAERGDRARADSAFLAW